MDSKTFLIGVVAIIFFFISFRGCKDKENKRQQVKYEKTPVDKLVRDLSAEQNFTIILYDMDYIESSDQYKHKYSVLIDRPDSVYTQETDWMLVSNVFFDANVDNMGMEIASKKDGKLTKDIAPAGYTNYVGNEKYGQWKEHNGSSFWEFYGKYAFISSMFRMAMFPVHYSYWNDYRSNYYGSGRAYYGPRSNGGRMYGTKSSYAQANSGSKWNSKSSDFKSRVRSKASLSSISSKSRTNRTTATKRTRSSSRYSSSSSRSRGGSFGK